MLSFSESLAHLQAEFVFKLISILETVGFSNIFSLIHIHHFLSDFFFLLRSNIDVIKKS